MISYFLNYGARILSSITVRLTTASIIMIVVPIYFNFADQASPASISLNSSPFTTLLVPSNFEPSKGFQQKMLYPPWKLKLLTVDSIHTVEYTNPPSSDNQSVDNSTLTLVDQGKHKIEVNLEVLIRNQLNKGNSSFGRGSFSNFLRREDPQEFLPITDPQSTKIIVVGAVWCSFCRPLTGRILDYFGNRENYLVEYFEFNDNNLIENPLVKDLIKRQIIYQNGKWVSVPFVLAQTTEGILDIERSNQILNNVIMNDVSKISSSSSKFLPLTIQASELFLVNVSKSLSDGEISFISQYPVSGVVLYKTKAEDINISEANILIPRINKLEQSILNQKNKLDSNSVPLPLIVATDQEGGLVQRAIFRDVCLLPRAENLESKSEEEIAHFARILSRDLIRAGINTNLNPILDLKNLKSTDITGAGRTYSEDPLEVVRISKILTRVMKENGLLVVGKHLPGIGEVRNSHNDSAESLFLSMDDLLIKQLIPFVQLANEKNEKESEILDGIMLGHVVLPRIDPSREVLSFSKVGIDQFRSTLNFKNGLILNDGFNMKSSLSKHDETSAPYFAILAGVAPVLVEPNHFTASLNYINERIKDPNVSYEEKVRFHRSVLEGKRLISLARVKIKKSEEIYQNIRKEPGCSQEDRDFLESLKGRDQVKKKKI